MPRQVTTAAAALAFFFLSATADAANNRTSSLSWVQLPGAEACGGAAAIARAVEQRLGRPALVSPAQADLSIEGRAERSGDSLRAVVVIRDSAGVQLGVRELESNGADCGELRENVALVVALMIDPDALLHPASHPPVAVAALPPRQTIVVERAKEPGAGGKPSSWRVEPAASVAIGYGFLPSVSVGALVTTTLLPPRFWAVEMYGGAWATQTDAVERGASARFTSVFGGVGLCPLRVQGDRAAFQLCAAGQVGVVGSEPTGFVTAQGGSLPTFHVVADAHLSFAVAPGIAARAGGSLAVALLGSKFVFDDRAGTQSLFDAPVLAATADLGIAVTVP